MKRDVLRLSNKLPNIIVEIDHDVRGITYLARPDAGAERKVILRTFPGSSSVDELELRRLLEMFDCRGISYFTGPISNIKRG
jgi:hypothetical protein